MNIDEAFELAAEFHGHKCPGLAIGVRAAEEAKKIFGIENHKDKEFTCVAENRACYIDGIQVLCGCTMGKRNLQFEMTGCTAFTFSHPKAEKAVRMELIRDSHSGSREERIQILLHDPLDTLFKIEEVENKAL